MTAVSYSRWQVYDQCPARFKYAYLDRLPEEKGPALERGSLIHSEAESYLKRELRELPSSLDKFTQDFKRLRKVRAQSEIQVAVSRDWTPTEWFGEDVWLRAVFDAVVLKKKLAWIIDFKTGKQRPVAHARQLELYGAMGFALYPVEEIATELWYLDTGVVEVCDFKREDAKRLQKLWVERLAPMAEDETFAPSPSPLCRWCSFSKRKDGPCKF